MITLHHLENSRSHRIIWLLEELGVEYQIKRYERDPKTRLAPKSLTDVHPLGKSPVITDGELTIAESAVIIEYLVETHGNGKFLPEKGTDEYRRYRYWMHAAEGSIMPLFVLKLILSSLSKKPVPLPIRPIGRAIETQVGKAYLNHSLKAQLDNMEAELNKSTFFAGDEITAADFLMVYPAQGVASKPDLASKYPKIRQYVDYIEALPTYQKALEAGGPFSFTP